MSSAGCADTNPILETVRFATQDNIKALAGGGQSAVTLDASKTAHRVTTVANNNDSVTLPSSKSGSLYIIANADASHSLNVFPAKGEAINALSANNAFAVASGKTTLFLSVTAGQWHAILTA